MARSACIHPSHQSTVSLALERNGFLTQGSLAAHLEIALSTVNNFCRGVKVSVAKFEEICEALGLEARALVLPASGQISSKDAPEAIATTASPPDSGDRALDVSSFFAYDAAWVGREDITQALAAQLEGEVRLMMIVGIAGVGKTALAERLVLEAGQRLIRLNFDHQEQISDFGSVAAQLLEKCGQPVTSEARQNPQQLRQMLFRHLQAGEYLILIDSLEALLTGDETGESQFEDEAYLAFFQQVLSAEAFSSRILLTSQELPAELLRFGTRYQNFWHYHGLTGLLESEQRSLFLKLGFDLDADGRDLMRIGKAYEGHPLALRIITGEIGSRPFFGNARAYWNRYGKEIEEVERSLAEAAAGNVSGAEDKWALDRFTRALRRNVQHRLEQTFERLERDARMAYVLLCEASVYRCPVPEDWWLSHLEYWDADEAAQTAAVDALRDRFLVEEMVEGEKYQLKQHNLIRSVALDRLRKLSFDGEVAT